MKEEVYHILDIVVQAISALVLAASISIGFYLQSKQLQEQYKNIYWTHQLESYNEICNTVGALAFLEPNTQEFETNRKKFLQIYYGSSNLFQDKNVEKKIFLIKEKLEDMPFDTLKNQYSSIELKTLSFQLSLSCRTSLSKTWKIEMDDLSKTK